MNQFPKIHSACCTDELRPIIGVVHITKQHIVATNSHILVIHDSNSLLTDKFIAGIPEEGINIHRDDFAKFGGKECELSWKSEGVIRVTYAKRSRPILIECESDSKYISYMAIVPTDISIGVAQKQANINIDYLHTLKTAMSMDIKNYTLTFYGETKAILVTTLTGSTDKINTIRGLIMPIKINK